MSSDFKENHLVLDSYLIVGNQVLSEIVNFKGFKSLSLAWLSFREGKTKLFRELWIFVVELVPQHKPQSGRIRKKWVSQSISSFSIKTVALEYFTIIFFSLFSVVSSFCLLWNTKEILQNSKCNWMIWWKSKYRR